MEIRASVFYYYYLKMVFSSAGEVVRLGVLVVLAEDLSLVSSTRVRLLTIAFNTSSKESDAFSCPHRYLHTPT